MDMIELKTSDRKIYSVHRSILKSFKMVNDLIECMDMDAVNAGTIPLKQVNSTIFEIILKWVDHYQNDQKNEAQSFDTTDVLSDFDRKFIAENDDYLFEIINAANFLGIEPMFERLCKHMASELSNKAASQLCEEYNIEEDIPKPKLR